ncbi:MAG TPA: hypothetical protein VEB43_00490 [Anaeromyxobacter sp.]|nr:hypothetical protein [Anaeromyxobacter sp.]
MHTSASPWRRLAWIALLAALSIGCATAGTAPAACLGRYEVKQTSFNAARQQASEAGDLLAQRLGRRALVLEAKFDRFRAVLDDEAADPGARVKLVVTHGEGEAWSVSVVKASPEEDERVRRIRAHVEQALKTLGVRWTFDLSDQDLKD